MLRTELRVQKRRMDRRLAPPTPLFTALGSVPLSPSQPYSSVRVRSLVPAFRSPTTTGSLEPSIPGSTFPTWYFAHAPAAILARSASQLHPRSRFAPVADGFFAFDPLRLLLPEPQAGSTTSAPLSGIYPVRIKAFSRFCLPFGPPFDFARSPLAPRCLVSFSSVQASDHRSRSATSSQACCSSNLLEPSSL